MEDKMMPSEDERTLMPDSRFPEFRNAGAWEEKSLDSLLDYQQPTGYLVSDTNYSDSYKTPVLTAGKTFILGYTNEQHGIFAENLPVIIFDDFTTATQFVDFPFKAKSSAMKILQARAGVSIKFMYEAMKMTSYEVGAHERHWISKFAPMSILVPELDEQQKIAECLASFDEVITLESQKLDTLKTHKQGLMQQLFPAEGESLPKLRFPEFRGGGEWEEKTLGQVAKYENGKAHEQDISEFGSFIVVNSKFISTDGEVKKFTDSAFCRAQKNDVLMVLSDVPNGRAIAKCFLVDSENIYTVNQRICKLTPYKELSVLLFYVLSRNSYFLAFDDGVKQTNLKKDDVLGCPIFLPSSLLEQQKIADCLTSIDDLITAQTQRLGALKNHKKGLMQQLFPAVDEVKV
ncbi:restriction endonuclease subunit S [Pseudomonas sp. S2.OTC.A_B10]|uniref:restriction endonuclease subunit S n=1 Tax=Pseudomonas sp. S2.OTC.A_B10 TaxID=3237018 RepID=UPI003CEAF004